MYSCKDHTFVVCAYGESPFLEECVQSLRNQTVQSRIIMVTSTPNELIERIAKQYQIPLSVNNGESGIAEDWNYGYSKCSTGLVTLAHQDDIYEPWYVQSILESLSDRKNPLIIFTDYGEIRNGVKVNRNRLLQIKRVMLLPLKYKKMQNCKWIRRRTLSFGSAISCPTVTYVKENLPKQVFQSGYKSDLDWQAWEMLSKREGQFIYCPKICMYHRIHEESATTSIIADHGRRREDFEMFCRFWPVPIARLIAWVYHFGEKSNHL